MYKYLLSANIVAVGVHLIIIASHAALDHWWLIILLDCSSVPLLVKLLTCLRKSWWRKNCPCEWLNSGFDSDLMLTIINLTCILEVGNQPLNFFPCWIGEGVPCLPLFLMAMILFHFQKYFDQFLWGLHQKISYCRTVLLLAAISRWGIVVFCRDERI